MANTKRKNKHGRVGVRAVRPVNPGADKAAEAFRNGYEQGYSLGYGDAWRKAFQTSEECRTIKDCRKAMQEFVSGLAS